MSDSPRTTLAYWQELQKTKCELAVAQAAIDEQTVLLNSAKRVITRQEHRIAELERCYKLWQADSERYRTTMNDADKRIAELERRQEIISCELQQKRLSMESCISHLAHIHSLLCPEGIRTVDKIYAFKPPVEFVREAWEGLSQAIRDIPDAIDAAREKEGK